MGWEDDADAIGIPKSVDADVPASSSQQSAGWEADADAIGIPRENATIAAAGPIKEPSAFAQIGQGALGTLKSFARGANTLIGEALPVDVVGPEGFKSPTGAKVPISGIADPAKRREIERGISDVATFGLAEKAGNAVDRKFAESAKADAEQAPGYREAGGLVGSTLPDAIGEAAGNVIKSIARNGEGKIINNRIADIVGNGADHGSIKATVSERKQLGKAAEPVKEVLATNEGANIANVARHDPSEAIQLTDKYIGQLSRSRPQDYSLVDKWTNGVDMGKVHDYVQGEIANLKGAGNKEKKAALKSLSDDIAESYGVNRETQIPVDIDTGGVPIEAVGGDLTKQASDPNFSPPKANRSGEREAGYSQTGGVESATSENATKAIPMSFGGQIQPTVELRDFATRLIKKYDTPAENELNQLKVDTIKKYLNKHLDKAAERHVDAKAAVERIREMNAKVMALSKIKTALSSRAAKQAAHGFGTMGIGATIGAAEGLANGDDLGKSLEHAVKGAVGGYVGHRFAIPLARNAANRVPAGLASLAGRAVDNGAARAASGALRASQIGGKEDDE